MESQQILSTNQFMAHLCEEYSSVTKVLVYYDSKAVLIKERTEQSDFAEDAGKKFKEAYFHPLHITIYKKDNKKSNLNKAAIDNEFGEDFGIHFRMNFKRRILKAHQINMLEILASKDTYRGVEFYPSRSILYRSHIPLLDKILEKHPENPMFAFRPKSDFNDDINEDEDFDDEILDSV